MADRPHQVQVHPGFKGGQQWGGGAGGGPSASKVIAVMTLVPLGGGLLALSSIALIGTLMGLAISTPLFIIFSPVLVPAAVVIALAVVSFLVSGAVGLGGLTSLSVGFKNIQGAVRGMPESLDQAKRRMQDMAGIVGQKTKEIGQDFQKKAQEK